MIIIIVGEKAKKYHRYHSSGCNLRKSYYPQWQNYCPLAVLSQQQSHLPKTTFTWFGSLFLHGDYYILREYERLMEKKKVRSPNFNRKDFLSIKKTTKIYLEKLHQCQKEWQHIKTLLLQDFLTPTKTLTIWLTSTTHIQVLSMTYRRAYRCPQVLCHLNVCVSLYSWYNRVCFIFASRRSRCARWQYLSS